MKTIGLIGGMSWESTVTYYQVINETIKQKLGGFHSAKILMYSVDFDEIETNMKSGDWSKNAAILSDAAKRLETAGADFILICTNTMHKVFDQVQAAVNVPLLHIADATGDVLKEAGIKKVGLLGTRYTMQQDFYKGRLAQAGFEVCVPAEGFIAGLNRIIFEELCVGVIKEDSRRFFAQAIEDLKDQGCEGVILGCTEIGLLVRPEDSSLPLFDTTVIHAQAAAKRALE